MKAQVLHKYDPNMKEKVWVTGEELPPAAAVGGGGSSSSTSSPGGNVRSDAAGSKARDGDAVLNVGDYEIDVGNCENVRCADTGVLLDPAAVRRGRLREIAEIRRFRAMSPAGSRSRRERSWCGPSGSTA